MSPLSGNEKSRRFRERNPAAAREINRRARLAYLFGMTTADYDAQLKEQGDRCAICSSREAGGRFNGRFYVDHDHETGEVRGLLCNRCNRAMGLFEDDPNLLLGAASYLDWRPWVVPQSRRAQLSLADEAC